MKTIIIVFLLSLSSLTGFSQSKQLVQYECQICGVDIWQCGDIPEPSRYYDEMGLIYARGVDMGCWDLRSKNEVAFVQFKIGEGRVCQECYEKYIQPLKEEIEATYEVAMKAHIYNNTKSREKYQKQRKDAEIKSLQEKIQELKDEIDIKEGRKVKDSNAWYIVPGHRIKVDTMSGLMRITNTDTSKWIPSNKHYTDSIVIKVDSILTKPVTKSKPIK